MPEELSPILMVDNEFDNISDLKRIIETTARYNHNVSGIPTEYVETASDAIGYLLERMEARDHVPGIISDIHLSGNNNFTEVDGDDFLRLIRGSLGYCHLRTVDSLDFKLGRASSFRDIEMAFGHSLNTEVHQFLQDNFDSFIQYKELVRYLAEVDPKLIIYCGHPEEVDLAGLIDIPVVRKGNVDSELEVLSVLEESGIVGRSYLESALSTDPRFSGKDHRSRKYNPRSRRTRKAMQEETSMMKKKKSTKRKGSQ